MSTRVLLACFSLAALTYLPAQAMAQAPARQNAQIVAEYPHDADAFTQGLFIHEGDLFETTGRVGTSSLRRVNLANGEVAQSVSIDPPYFGEGATQIGDRIFMLTWRRETGFIFDADTFEPIGEFSYPGEGWGLTHDGNSLILSDGTAELRRLDPETLEETGRLTVRLGGRPVRRLNELEWVDGEIWANIWQSDLIVRIDPESGNVTGLIDLGDIIPEAVAGSLDAVPNGIAWNAQTGQVYVTGKLWPALYEISLSPPD
ncbi:glutaminyl-peptide cyclotransferase [Maricaulis parjimensis]|uniref:glutaminyl-peptide cyclotransferase n=1 Tax=Maricaulis parjimensis TaxID=144023 RepID=UPI0019399E3B|nr:glutaminyl-peptide cyclotransferase [Maricaulis parjimensis]